jgi:hypothetical protein
MARRQEVFDTDRREPLAEVPEFLRRRPTPPPKRDRSWDAKRSRATYDLPAALIERVRTITGELAEAHPEAKVRVSDVARMLLAHGVEAYESGELGPVDVSSLGETLLPD